MLVGMTVWQKYPRLVGITAAALAVLAFSGCAATKPTAGPATSAPGPSTDSSGPSTPSPGTPSSSPSAPIPCTPPGTRDCPQEPVFPLDFICNPASCNGTVDCQCAAAQTVDIWIQLAARPADISNALGPFATVTLSGADASSPITLASATSSLTVHEALEVVIATDDATHTVLGQATVSASP
jgi:hypothetical protein